MSQSIKQNSIECNRFLQEPCFHVLHALISVHKSGTAPASHCGRCQALFTKTKVTFKTVKYNLTTPRKCDRCICKLLALKGDAKHIFPSIDQVLMRTSHFALKRHEIVIEGCLLLSFVCGCE